MTCLVRSPAATKRIGVRLGRLLAPGDFIGLEGDLGVGKTVLARGIAEGAGVDPSEVASPSFAIVYSYRGRLPLHHTDFYRVAGVDELYATGFFDLVGGEGALVVEWVDRVREALPQDHLLVRITCSGERARRLTFLPEGNRHRALCDALAADLRMVCSRARSKDR
jgi:tRNA threonylcarbamoyladenosine biosynthesis protein TsaE